MTNDDLESARKDQRIEELELAITRYRRVAEQHAAGDVSYDLLSKARRQLFAVIRGGAEFECSHFFGPRERHGDYYVRTCRWCPAVEVITIVRADITFVEAE